MVESERGRHLEAAAALKEAVRLAPRLTEARARLGNALGQAGQWAEAADVLEAAVVQDPLRHPGSVERDRAGPPQPGPARRARSSRLRRAVALDPRLAIARVNLGAALLASGDLPAARAQFEAALRIDPRERSAIGNLGLILAQQGEIDAARARFQEVLRLDPSDARARCSPSPHGAA